MPDIMHSENYQITGNRRCGICKLIKPVSDFPRRKSGRYAGAILHCCHDCNLDRVHTWNKNHPGATAKRNHAKGKCLPYTESKDCHYWIGIHVAERLTLNYFKDYYQMPFGNHGYDLMNGKSEKIDCKASLFRVVSHGRYGWQFAIDRNTIPTWFFCIGFGHAKDDAPLRAWKIPMGVVSHLMRLSIYPGERSLRKWAQYELPLEGIIKSWKEIQ